MQTEPMPAVIVGLHRVGLYSDDVVVLGESLIICPGGAGLELGLDGV